MANDTKVRTSEGKSARAKKSGALEYQSGFGNQFVSEAVPGALPIGRNNPQRPAHGLYTELI